MKQKATAGLLIAAFFAAVQPEAVQASTLGVDIQFGEQADLTSSMKTFVLIGLLALAPSFFLMITPYPYIAIVLGLAKQGLGTQAVPPTQVLAGLAIFMTFFIMKPVGMEVYENAYLPYEKGDISFEEFAERAEKPIKAFMVKNTEQQSLLTFIKIGGEEKPKSIEEVSLSTAIPSYAVSMMNLGLQKGLMIYAGFLVLDLVIGAVLMMLGMMMLPPQMVSVPFKLLIFLAIGGFNILVELIYAGIRT